MSNIKQIIKDNPYIKVSNCKDIADVKTGLEIVNSLLEKSPNSKVLKYFKDNLDRKMAKFGKIAVSPEQVNVLNNMLEKITNSVPNIKFAALTRLEILLRNPIDTLSEMELDIYNHMNKVIQNSISFGQVHAELKDLAKKHKYNMLGEISQKSPETELHDASNQTEFDEDDAIENFNADALSKFHEFISTDFDSENGYEIEDDYADSLIAEI